MRYLEMTKGLHCLLFVVLLAGLAAYLFWSSEPILGERLIPIVLLVIGNFVFFFSLIEQMYLREIDRKNMYSLLLWVGREHVWMALYKSACHARLKFDENIESQRKYRVELDGVHDDSSWRFRNAAQKDADEAKKDFWVSYDLCRELGIDVPDWPRLSDFTQNRPGEREWKKSKSA